MAAGHWVRRAWLACSVLFVAALLVAGCAHKQTRFQSAEDVDRDRDEVTTIGDVSAVGGAESLHLMGVGLVVNLEGTGGGVPPGDHRTWLEGDLRKRAGLEKIKPLLASSDVALVFVSAYLPPGARKGDPIDVDVTVPPQSKTTSLRGGYLVECLLYNHENVRNLDPTYTGPDLSLRGHALARAEGSVIVGLGDGDEAATLRRGRIWGGGRAAVPRPFHLVLNENRRFARLAQVVAERINETFHGSFPGATHDLAVAQTKEAILLQVPPRYHLNQLRFLRVVRLMPLRDDLGKLCENRLAPGSTRGAIAVGTGSPYQRRLEEELLDPARTITAALRLEALGPDSIPVLKRGLESEHTLVRFASAEALAYLGSPSCGEELARLAEQQPMLRAFALTALASLDEAISHVKLRELLATPSAQTRYGAFRALRALDEREPAIRGEEITGGFWLHRVVPNAAPLVHLSTSRRAEVVLFGDEPQLVPPFSFLAGEFTITAGQGDEHCTVSRFSTRSGTSRRQCGLKLEEVLRSLADQGGGYPDAVELLRQADRCKSLTCQVAVDALPQGTSVYDLARAGANDPDLNVDVEILEARADFGATPTLFEKTGDRRRRSTVLKDQEAALRDKKKSATTSVAERK
jgi:hypothetical protein